MTAAVFDAASTIVVTSGNATTFSWTHTPVGTPTGVGLFILNYEPGGVITGITYGGVAMTQYENTGDLNGSGVSLQVWGLSNPPSGAQSVVITNTLLQANLIFIDGGAITVTGGRTSGSPFRDTKAAYAYSGNFACVAPRSQVGDLVADIGYLKWSSNSTATPGATQTQQWTVPGVYGSTAPGLDGVTPLSWTWADSATTTQQYCGGAAGSFASTDPTSSRVYPGPFKKTGIPRLNTKHPLAQGLVYYGIDTGLGFIHNLLPYSTPMTPGPASNGLFSGGAGPWSAAQSSINAPTVPTDFGAAQDWLQNNGSDAGHGHAGWTDVTSQAVIPNAIKLSLLGAGAGNTFACGMMHKGFAVPYTTGTDNPAGIKIGSWIFGSMDYAAEHAIGGNYCNFAFYKQTGNNSQVYAQLLSNPSSHTSILLGPYTVVPGAYTTLAVSTLNTGSGTGTSTFYADGEAQGNASSVAMTFSTGNGENSIDYGSVFHVQTGNSTASFDGSVFWGAVWNRALTPAEHRLLKSDPYCFLDYE